MATNLSIGVYLPSVKIPFNVLDINQLGFVVSSQQCHGSQIISDHYPEMTLPIRSYIVGNGKNHRAFIERKKEQGKTESHVQIVFNELFDISGNLKAGTKEPEIIYCIRELVGIFSNIEIIFNEMNTYRITHYTGNGFQDNGVLRLIQKMQRIFPSVRFSLGIQTIGNKLCKDLILKSLPVVLNHIKSLDWFLWPIHFTEVGYYHDPYLPQQQINFLDEIKSIAEANGVASLCYIYPWDGDNFPLPGQPRNTFCGIWDEDWNVKYDIFA
jgi:hypothetical protein